LAQGIVTLFPVGQFCFRKPLVRCSIRMAHPDAKMLQVFGGRLTGEGFEPAGYGVEYWKECEIFSSAHDILTSLLWEDGSFDYTHDIVMTQDHDASEFPEVYQAWQVAGGNEGLQNVATVAPLSKWGVGFGGKKNGERAAKLALAISCANDSPNLQRVCRDYPEFGDLLGHLGVIEGWSGGGGYGPAKRGWEGGDVFSSMRSAGKGSWDGPYGPCDGMGGMMAMMMMMMKGKKGKGKGGGKGAGSWGGAGKGGAAPQTYDAETEEKLNQWVSAKRSKDYETADQIRAELREQGVEPDDARPPGWTPEWGSVKSMPHPSSNFKKEQKIWLGNIPGDINFTRMKEIMVEAGSNPKFVSVGKGGTGQACFDTPEEASEAILMFNGSQIGEQTIQVDTWS